LAQDQINTEKTCFKLFSRFSSKIPVTFMTGFYFANVYARYWDQFTSLPKPDKLAHRLVAFVGNQVK
jgi:hypothetical protein